MEHLGTTMIEKTEVLGEKPAPLLLGPPKMPNEMAWEWALASAVIDRRKSAVAMAWPLTAHNVHLYDVIKIRLLFYVS
jgi:hypothetical protein